MIMRSGVEMSLHFTPIALPILAFRLPSANQSCSDWANKCTGGLQLCTAVMNAKLIPCLVSSSAGNYYPVKSTRIGTEVSMRGFDTDADFAMAP